MSQRSRFNHGDASKRDQKKAQKKQNLQQYYADDMVDEADKKATTNNPQRNNVIMEEEEEEIEIINLDDRQAKERLNKENMDRVSEILVTMIFKNKVNSKNAFDVPLPNVQQLSDFHHVNGDNSWKKLSQTLDAGAKIYGYRVDSVHNETYKVLGGLNRTELAEAAPEVEVGPTAEEERENRKTKKDLDGEGTLEKNLNNIDTNKYDLEFDLDPLFQKTSAKFDEGGAKGLLLNNVSINADVNLMFDSGNILENQKEVPQQKKNKITQATFNNIQGLNMDYEELLQYKLCPELQTFKTQYMDKIKDIHDLLHVDKGASQKIYAEGDTLENLMAFENIEEEEKMLKNELEKLVEYQDDPINAFNMHNDGGDFGHGHDDDDDPAMSQNLNIHENTGSNTNPFTIRSDEHGKELNFLNIEERISNLGAGKALDTLVNDHRNWMGPEAWKMNVNKKTKIITGKENQKENQKEDLKSKKKLNDVVIEFDLAKKENPEDIFGPKRPAQPKNQEKSQITFTINPNTVLPMDYQVKTYRLNNIFLRSINFKVQDKNEIENDKLTHIEEPIEAPMDDMSQMGFGPEFEDELKKNLGAFEKRPESGAEKSHRNVNIKALKESIWSYLEDKIPEMEHDMEDELNRKKKSPKKSKHKTRDRELITFSKLNDNIAGVIGNKQKNVTVHSCFVALLHLANEKGLHFIKEAEDFAIYKELF